MLTDAFVQAWAPRRAVRVLRGGMGQSEGALHAVPVVRHREAAPDGGRLRGTLRVLLAQSEKDAKLAQKLGQLQPFIAVFPH